MSPKRRQGLWDQCQMKRAQRRLHRQKSTAYNEVKMSSANVYGDSALYAPGRRILAHMHLCTKAIVSFNQEKFILGMRDRFNVLKLTCVIDLINGQENDTEALLTVDAGSVVIHMPSNILYESPFSIATQT